jgi:hypothetical protein
MIEKSRKWWFLSVLLLLLTAGCNRQGDKQSTPSGMVDPGIAAALPDTQGTEKTFTVTLLPEAPRAGDALIAVVRGTGGSFVFSWEKNGGLLAQQNKTRLSLPGLVRGDVVRVVVTAGDTEASAETVIENTPPEVESVVVKTPYLCRGADLEVEARGRDVDGDSVEFMYVWEVDGRELFYETDAVLAGDAYEKGNVVKLTVIPRDGEEDGKPFAKGLEFEVGDAPPEFVSTPPVSFNSAEYRYQSKAVDADEDEITYELTKGPEGMTIDPESGLIQWSIPADATGSHEVRIEARDAEGMMGWQEYTLQIKRGEEKQ